MGRDNWFVGDSKFVYTLSDVGDLVKSTIRSVNSLLNFVDKKDIVIFYTPPRSKKVFNKLSRMAEVRKVENITEPFKFQEKRFGRFGEKIQLCNVDDPNVIFLNSDTEIIKNPRDLLIYDYDVSGRIGMGYLDFDFDIWENMFEGRKVIPMLNAGFLIFKDFAHKKIRNKWLEYIEKDLDNPHPTQYFKDQYSLVLAISYHKDLKIRYMNKYEHSFMWNNDYVKTYVKHGHFVYKEIWRMFRYGIL